jgi:ubiquinone/menaquinone biosynthesis C-methylase UbiE
VSLLSDPRLYDLVQTLAGAHRIRLRLKRHFDTFPPETRILDLGGGTGAIAPYLPQHAKYTCLDGDWAKLRGLRARLADAAAILSDATNVPIRSDSIDVVLCIAVAHHLTDSELDLMFRETRRVLKSGGRLVFLDPLAGPRVATRLMWSIDRGSYPRSPDALRAAVGKHFTAVWEDRHTIWHEYLTILGRKD